MTFGEKLFKLRKEKGLSQESLAEQVGTTRQAISKWENNQGFPETEKLLLLSNIFGVSVDFLLKEDKTTNDADAHGFYVSREMAAGYIENQIKESKYIGVGFMCFVMTGIPFVMFSDSPIWKFLGMSVLGILGICSFVMGVFSEQRQYKVLKEEPLMFDTGYLKELSDEYQSKKRVYVAVFSVSLVLFIVGIIVLALTIRGTFPWSEYHSFVFLSLSIGLMGVCYCAGIIDAYELLIENEQYSTRLLFKIKRKVKEKIDKL